MHAQEQKIMRRILAPTFTLNLEDTMSNEAKRTPGPWYATHHPDGYTDVQSASTNEDNYVAKVDYRGDAALISAAPGLLAAAKTLHDALSSVLEDGEYIPAEHRGPALTAIEASAAVLTKVQEYADLNGSE